MIFVVAAAITIFFIAIAAVILLPKSSVILRQRDFNADSKTLKTSLSLVKPDILLPIISSNLSFYISNLRMTAPTLITSTNAFDLIYNLTFDVLAKSVFNTTTDALVTQLVSPEMTISLIRLRDLLGLYEMRRKMSKIWWLYYDLWEGSMSMQNNFAFLMNLVRKRRKIINSKVDEIQLNNNVISTSNSISGCCFIDFISDKDEEAVANYSREFFIELMRTVPNLVYKTVIYSVKKTDGGDGLSLDEIIKIVFQQNPVIGRTPQNNMDTSVVSETSELIFGNAEFAELDLRIVKDMVEGLMNAFSFQVKDDKLVIKEVR